MYVKHPQTNVNLERIHEEIQRKWPEFESILMQVSNPLTPFMKWYNYERPYMSLDYDNPKTRWEAFQRKMSPAENIVVDGQTRDI